MEAGTDPVSCPVCTLYMREGVTLQNHLNTHPKDQVIAALVRISGGGSNGLKENQNGNEITPVPTSEAPSGSQQQVSPVSQFTPNGSSHFTTAITYQQFLSSNGSATSTVMPQYVSMPTILSAPTIAHSSANPTFMQMLYNPYAIQQQQQQQQFQLLSSVTSPSHQQHYIRPLSYQPQINLGPASVPLTIPYQTAGFSGDVSLSSLPQGYQSSTNNNIPSSVPLPTSSSSFSNSTVSCPSSAARNTIQNIASKDHVSSDNVQDAENKPPSPEHTNSSTEVVRQQLADVSVVSSNVSDTSVGLPTSMAYSDTSSGIDSGIVTQSSSTQCEDEDQKSPYTPKDEENCGNDKDIITVENELDERQQDVSQSDPLNVRVRTDLNVVAVSPVMQLHDLAGAENVEEELSDEHLRASPLQSSEEMSQISGIIRNALRIQTPLISVPDNDEYITSDRPYPTEDDTAKNDTDSVIDNDEYITSDRSYPTEDNSGKKNSGDVLDTEEDKCKKADNTREEGANKFLDLDTSETVNIIEIEGLHILVPSQLLENQRVIDSVEVPQSRDPQLDATMVNIQTDETMPPRGELSEQESVGGNDSSMWVQAFQEKEVSTSYDLLARESWGASDGSDADIIPDREATPSVVTRQETSGQDGKKTRANRVFKCATCGEAFNCPKERRVHRSTYHSVKSGNSEGVASASADKEEVEVISRRHKRKGRKQKTIKEEEDDKICVKAEEPKFTTVYVNQDETTIKMEDANVGPLTENTPTEANSNKVEDEPVPKQEEDASVFPCNECGISFSSAKLRLLHDRRLHKKPKHNTCTTCNEAFDSDVDFHLHLRKHPLECLQCGKYFYRRQNLDLHVKRHLGIKPHKCTICDKAFITKQKLAEHTNSHTGNAPIKCPFCDETFRRYSNLIQHKHRHHMNIKKKVKDFICHCGEIFHTKKKLEWHKEIHEEKPKCCTYCSERFVHAASLTRHIRKAHDCRYVPKCGREVENVECTVCGYVFLKSSLQVHMRMHNGERPYPCHVCGKDFTTKWNLQLHRWTHAARSTKPFKCSLCKSAFFRRNDYTAHMHSHRNVRPYTCNHCGCQFIRKYNCLRHVREHEVGKAFTCNVCGKMFHRSYYLKEHSRVHSGARPFACHICGKASSTKSNHNKHVKIHHAREPVNTEG